MFGAKRNGQNFNAQSSETLIFINGMQITWKLTATRTVEVQRLQRGFLAVYNLILL